MHCIVQNGDLGTFGNSVNENIVKNNNYS